jgi:ESCRT-II complex subunit VPS25
MYSFPPFFTKQPNRDTEAKRLQVWRDLIISYCRHHKVYVLELNDSTISSPLFFNASISRRLTKTEIAEILQMMTSAGLAEWIPGDSNKFIVFWRSPAEWADAIFSWVVKQGHTDSIMTMFEFKETSAPSGQCVYCSFHVLDPKHLFADIGGVHEAILMKAIKVLEGRGKAVLLDSENGAGIKWFS